LKIVDLHTRKTFDSYPVPGEPCEATIKAAEELLAAAKTGELTGLIAMTWKHSDASFERTIVVPRIKGLTFSNVTAMMLGAMHMLTHDLKDMAFWTQGYRPIVLDIVEGEFSDEDEDEGDENEEPDE
jgi:hypothetical protein